jgi:hypothetical protein
MEQPPTLRANARNDRTVQSHLSGDDVAAFVDGRVSSEQRSGIEAHLAVCADCRAEVVAVSALVESAPAAVHRRSRWPLVGTGAAAAAAILLFVFLPVTRNRRPTTAAGERAPSNATQTIEIIGPAPGVQVSHDSVRFIWHRDDGSSYRFFLTDSTGTPHYTTSTNDTTLLLPPTVHLDAGALYFWRVDGLRSDGTSPSSPTAAFTIRQP